MTLVQQAHCQSVARYWMRKYRLRPLCAVLVFAVGCGNPRVSDGQMADANTKHPQTMFWESIQALCGQSFEGRVAESEPPDPSFESQRLIMHVRECGPNLIRIPFHVGEDRSRTWLLSRTTSGLRLKHDHRHEDGSEDEVTQYGGDTRSDGSVGIQDFYADAMTADLVPAASANIWTIEIEPGNEFVYALRREGATRRFRAEFDLGLPVSTPPPPWGAKP